MLNANISAQTLLEFELRGNCHSSYSNALVFFLFKCTLFFSCCHDSKGNYPPSCWNVPLKPTDHPAHGICFSRLWILCQLELFSFEYIIKKIISGLLTRLKEAYVKMLSPWWIPLQLEFISVEYRLKTIPPSRLWCMVFSISLQNLVGLLCSPSSTRTPIPL